MPTVYLSMNFGKERYILENSNVKFGHLWIFLTGVHYMSEKSMFTTLFSSDNIKTNMHRFRYRILEFKILKQS